MACDFGGIKDCGRAISSREAILNLGVGEFISGPGNGRGGALDIRSSNR